jgi:hypothetical protein
LEGKSKRSGDFSTTHVFPIIWFFFKIPLESIRSFCPIFVLHY